MKKAIAPIAMKCSKKQFKEIEPKLKKLGKIGMLNGAFKQYKYLTNNYNHRLEFDFIGNTGMWQSEHQNNIHETWNEKVFLQACGIETEPEYVIAESEEELWLPVHNYHGFYEVSNMGNVRSLSRKVKHSKNPEFTKNVFGRLLSKSINTQGYNKVRLSMYGDKKTHLVYHLVSEAFLGHTERSEFVCVDHIDEDKTNDKASNLQIITKQQNTKKSFDYKLDQFKEGDYWFHNTGDLVLISEVTKLHGGTIKCKHINNTEHFAFHGICVMDIKATPEEVIEALTKEAVKRYKAGDYVKSINSQCIYKIHDDDFDLPNNTWLKMNGISVFKEGVWSTVVETITKEDAEKELGKKILN